MDMGIYYYYYSVMKLQFVALKSMGEEVVAEEEKSCFKCNIISQAGKCHLMTE